MVHPLPLPLMSLIDIDFDNEPSNESNDKIRDSLADEIAQTLSNGMKLLLKFHQFNFFFKKKKQNSERSTECFFRH